jgi:hypothetical protein
MVTVGAQNATITVASSNAVALTRLYQILQKRTEDLLAVM